MANLSKTKIGDLEFNIMQGAMGVAVSGRKLVSAVANCGGIGVLAAAELASKNYSGLNYIESNRQALREEIRATRELSPQGIIGVNIMRALTDYSGLVEVASKENIDLIVSGAGFAKDLPLLVKNPKIKLIPIVSSVRAAKIMVESWIRYNKIPDAIVVEGPDAGGHLGFKLEELTDKINPPNLEKIATEIKQNYPNIPIIVAGGIYTGQDIKYYHEKGFGVQMSTRFVTTKECDADDKFKYSYINAKEEDIKLIQSPVGMPGRAIINPFLKRAMNGEETDFKCKYNCLKTCKPKESLYCISDALRKAQQGKLEEGFTFAGTNAYRATKESCQDKNGNFHSVEALIEKLTVEFNST